MHNSLFSLDTKKNLTATPFSYINNASDNSNEVCLHITHLFLKALVFVSNVFLLPLLSHDNLHSLPIVVSSVFSPESTPLVIQQSPLLYSANLFICVFFLMFIYFIVITDIFFQIDRLEPSFTDSVFRFRFRDSVPVSGFRIPCFSAADKLIILNTFAHEILPVDAVSLFEAGRPLFMKN